MSVQDNKPSHIKSHVEQTQTQAHSTQHVSPAEHGIWGHIVRWFKRMPRIWKKNSSSAGSVQKGGTGEGIETKSTHVEAVFDKVQDERMEVKPEIKGLEPKEKKESKAAPADLAFRDQLKGEIKGLKAKLKAKLAELESLEGQRSVRPGRDALDLIRQLNEAPAQIKVLKKQIGELEVKLDYFEFKIAPPPPFQVTSMTYSELAAKSQEFQSKVPMPTTDNQIAKLDQKEAIAAHANQARPIIDAKVWMLATHFLERKRTSGTDKEKALYQNMTPTQFFDRLLTKRPLMFMGVKDYTVDRNGQERTYANLPLEDYISYDEMRISAYIGTSTPTFFINDGKKDNFGIRDKEGNFQTEGVLYGLVGDRFEKPGYMEDSLVMIRRGQKRDSEEIKMWESFLHVDLPSFEEVVPTSSRFIKIDADTYFDKEVYKATLTRRIEPFQLDANERAKEANKSAFLHLQGLGTGVWKPAGVDPAVLGGIQKEIYAEGIQKMQLDQIGTLNYSYFPSHTKIPIPETPIRLGNHTIEVRSNKRAVAEKLEKDMLLCATYPWDSNSFPGNEYWARKVRMLSDSMDPAAICCSTLGELQNPMINSNISGDNLRVYFSASQEQKEKWDKEAEIAYAAKKPERHQVSVEHAPSEVVENVAQNQLHLELEEFKSLLPKPVDKAKIEEPILEEAEDFDWKIPESLLSPAQPQALKTLSESPEMQDLTKKIATAVRESGRLSFMRTKSMDPQSILKQIFDLSERNDIPISFLLDEMQKFKSALPTRYKETFDLLQQCLEAKKTLIKSDALVIKSEADFLKGEISFTTAKMATKMQQQDSTRYEILKARLERYFKGLK